MAGNSSEHLVVSTWNINSVRLRRGLVEDFLASARPDILCLQETKCQDAEFPASAFAKLGYGHIALHGQKGYHGVAMVSKRPLHSVGKRDFCGMGDARHIECVVKAADRAIRIHNFYVPAGGDEPDPEVNVKFAHKLKFLDEMRAVTVDAGIHDSAILVGDLNVAPLENDVWSHKQMLKVVSHTPVETETMEDLRVKAGWVDLMRQHVPPSEKLFTWWSYRSQDWLGSNRGRRLDHVWGSENLASALRSVDVLSSARGWERPSDHVPVTARFSF